MEAPIDDSEHFQPPHSPQPSSHYFQPPPQMMQPPPPPPPPPQQVFYARDVPSVFPKLDKPMYVIIFVAFLLGFFMGKTQPIVLRSS